MQIEVDVLVSVDVKQRWGPAREDGRWTQQGRLEVVIVFQGRWEVVSVLRTGGSLCLPRKMAGGLSGEDLRWSQ